MPTVASSALPEAITTGALARAVGRSERVIAGRKADGRLPAHPDGGIALGPILLAGIEALAREQRSDPDAERRRLEVALLQARLDRETGTSLPREEVVAAMQVAFANARARLLALPTKAAPAVLGNDSLADVREVLTGFVHEACAELADTRAVSEAADQPGSRGGRDGGDGGLGAAAAADGERVG